MRTWQNENEAKTLTKVDFAPVFKRALDNSNISQHIIKGFERCGLFPYNPEAVDYTKCVQNTLENLEQNVHQMELEGKLSSADFKSTHKVLTSLKSNLLDRVTDVDWLLNELIAFENEILGDKTQITNEGQENIYPMDNAVVGEYNINVDGSLSLIQQNEPLIQANESIVNILRVDVLNTASSSTNSTENKLHKEFLTITDETQVTVEGNNTNIGEPGPTFKTKMQHENVPLDMADLINVDEEIKQIKETEDTNEVSQNIKICQNKNNSSKKILPVYEMTLNQSADFF